MTNHAINGVGQGVVFDALGRVTRVTDALGRVTTWLRDIQGRVTDKIYPDGTPQHKRQSIILRSLRPVGRYSVKWCHG